MTTSDFDVVTRRFPLIPRPEPARRPLQQHLADIAALARTPAGHPEADARIASAHNQAALIASNHGHPDLARALCWRHHDRYLTQQPWNARQTRLALEPLINLARLHIRNGQSDTAIELLESLLHAVSHHDTATIDGRNIDLNDTIATTHDRSTIRQWLWIITLNEGIRALARAGRWHHAHRHAHRYRGVGTSLLDGRQVAIIARIAQGDQAGALKLLEKCVLPQPWQGVVALVLELLIRRQLGDSTKTLHSHFLDLNRGKSLPDPTTTSFTTETQLATMHLADESTRPAALALLTRTAEVTSNGATAHAILTHPTSRDLPRPTLERLASLRLSVTVDPDLRLLETSLAHALS